MGMLVIGKDQGVYLFLNERIELNTGKILMENLVQSAFQQTLEDKFTLQQDNGQQYTLVAYQDDIECSSCLVLT